MDLTQYQNKGYTGLSNLGNTCFLNASMQVLNHTYELAELLNRKKYVKHIKVSQPEAAILAEWTNLREVMWANNGVVSPNRFVYHIHRLARAKNRDIFTGWAQNDMPEFLLFMIECMHNSISRSINMRILGNVENEIDRRATECYGMLQKIYLKEYSEIMDMFYGICISEIISMDGQILHSIKPEHFFILDMELPSADVQNPSLYDCLDSYTKYEVLEGENAWFNEKTNQKENIKKRITFWNFPKILVITLKRFSPCGTYKNGGLIQFPLNDLDLSKYMSGYNASHYKYDLYGVCNHMGGTQGGHYTSYIKNATNEWIHYDDSSVSIIKEEEVVSNMAYCLFYRKKNNPV